jgi:hypothetical protein
VAFDTFRFCHLILRDNVLRAEHFAHRHAKVMDLMIVNSDANAAVLPQGLAGARNMRGYIIESQKAWIESLLK